MEDRLCGKISLFVKLESAISRTYTLLIPLRPDKAELWKYLSSMEESHALVGMLAHRYCLQGKLKQEEFIPFETSDIQAALEKAEKLNRKLSLEGLPLSEALAGLLEVEQEACERFEEFIGAESSSVIITRLQRLLTDQHAHVGWLRRFIEKQAE